MAERNKIVHTTDKSTRHSSLASYEEETQEVGPDIVEEAIGLAVSGYRTLFAPNKLDIS